MLPDRVLLLNRARVLWVPFEALDKHKLEETALPKQQLVETQAAIKIEQYDFKTQRFHSICPL
jgi:hypothetical protein